VPLDEAERAVLDAQLDDLEDSFASRGRRKRIALVALGIDAVCFFAMTLPVPDEVHQGEGCDQCRRLGYRGRIGVYELWRIDQEDYDLILHGADEKTLYKALQVKAHATLLHDALEKVVDGITSVAEMQSMGELVPPIQTGLKVAGGR